MPFEFHNTMISKIMFTFDMGRSLDMTFKSFIINLQLSLLWVQEMHFQMRKKGLHLMFLDEFNDINT